MYQDARRPTLVKGSRRNIAYTLDGFTDHLGGDMALRAVRPRHIEGWLGAHQWVPSTARNRLSTVRTFFQWTVENGLIKANPCISIKGPRQPRSLPRELSTEEVHRVLEQAPDARAALILSLIFHEGLRRAEIARMEVGDIDQGVISVIGKGGHHRLLPLSAATEAALTRYLGEHPAASGPLIRNYNNAGSVTPDTIGYIVTGIMFAAGVKARPHDGRSAHAGRHTFAGAMLDEGADLRVVSSALGHENLSTTSIYLRRRQTVADIREFLPTYREAQGGIQAGM